MLQAGVDTSVEYLDEYDVPAELVVAAELSAGGLLPLLSAPMSGQQRRDAWLAMRSTADKVK